MKQNTAMGASDAAGGVPSAVFLVEVEEVARMADQVQPQRLEIIAVAFVVLGDGGCASVPCSWVMYAP
jgi:hypothetical protein